MDMNIDPDFNHNPRKRTVKKGKIKSDAMVQNTWILLGIAWIIFLIPFPGTSYIASVLILGGFVMTVTTLARGKTQQGIIQLLSIFIVTPMFSILGMMIFWTSVSKAIDINKITADSIKRQAISDYNRELRKLRRLERKIYQPRTRTNKKKEEKKEIILVKYIVHLKGGGKIECNNLDRKGNSVQLTNRSGLFIDLHLSKIEKIEKFETVNNRTNVSSWQPGNKG